MKMNYYIKVNGEYIFRIYKGNYYICPLLRNKSLCALSKQRAKRYENRLSSMGVAYELEVEE